MTVQILVVEDDPNILLSVEFLLQNAGYGVQTATDGMQAWAALQASPPDLVVLDVMLPAIDGFELCRRIRASALLARTRVLMLSARGGEPELVKSLQLGAAAYLRKPFATRELLETVAKVLEAD
jgi:two-component system, OmpR family, alkaline phosphatase synthesis response regulator PhoP